MGRISRRAARLLACRSRWGGGGGGVGSSPPARPPPRKSLMSGEAVRGVGCLRGDLKTDLLHNRSCSLF